MGVRAMGKKGTGLFSQGWIYYLNAEDKRGAKKVKFVGGV